MSGRSRKPAVSAFLLLVVLLGACSHDLTREEAAAMLRVSRDFTTRRNSPVRRELVEINAVRHVGPHATEVEFTWKDVPSKDGSVKTSMALFRTDDDREWKLTSLYKVGD